MHLLARASGRAAYVAVGLFLVALVAWFRLPGGSRPLGPARVSAPARRGRPLLLLTRVVSWVAYLLLAFLLLAVIGWSATPRVLGWQPQVVLSGSMEPALSPGSVVFVEPRDAQDVAVGDILTFRHPDNGESLVSHRVMEVTRVKGSPAFRTKGDANASPDDWLVPAGNVVGTIRYSLPYMGYVTQRARTPLGFALLIGLPAAVVVLRELRNIARQLWGRREEVGS